MSAGIALLVAFALALAAVAWDFNRRWCLRFWLLLWRYPYFTLERMMAERDVWRVSPAHHRHASPGDDWNGPVLWRIEGIQWAIYSRHDAWLQSMRRIVASADAARYPRPTRGN
jgi:hypothetical protein